MQTPNISLTGVTETKETAVLRTSLTSPKTFYSSITVSTPKEAFTSKSLSIGGISRAINDVNHLSVKALLNIILADIILFVNVGKTMTREQLTETVSLIVKQYSHFKPEDFKICFEGVKLGNYGALYDRIDGQVILSWLKAYDQERDYIAAEIASNDNEVRKMTDAHPLLPQAGTVANEDQAEVLQRNLTIWKERLSKIGKEKEQPAFTERVSNPVYEMHQRWLNQFDIIWKRQGYPDGRRIKRYGIMKNPFYKPHRPNEPEHIPRLLDKNAYLEHKQWQYEQYLNRNSESIKTQ